MPLTGEIMEIERFTEWLKQNGISSYENYISRLKNVEDF